MTYTSGAPQRRSYAQPDLDRSELGQVGSTSAPWVVAAGAVAQTARPSSAPVRVDMSAHAAALAEDQAAQDRQEAEERAALAERTAEEENAKKVEAKARISKSKAVDKIPRMNPKKKNPAITPRMSRNDSRFRE